MKPLLTTLNYSGGRQSSALLWMVIRGEIETPKNFVVINANPGMERGETYRYQAMMADECKRAGLEVFNATGPNLYSDIVNIPADATRLDNPPYWTKGRKGRIGRLVQKCTKHYKIAPMDRVVRQILFDRFGISKKSGRLGNNIVEKWIGFSADEERRITDSHTKYVYFRYPLAEMGMDIDDVMKWYRDAGISPPPLRSMCNACFAHGLRSLKDMYDNHPGDWAQAVAVDDSIRDWKQIGVDEPCYVSSTLIPLRVLAENDFRTGDELTDELNTCDSGYCFI